MAATGTIVPCLQLWDPNLALAVFELGPREHVGRKCKVSFIRDRGSSAKLRHRWQQQLCTSAEDYMLTLSLTACGLISPQI